MYCGMSEKMILQCQEWFGMSNCFWDYYFYIGLLMFSICIGLQNRFKENIFSRSLFISLAFILGGPIVWFFGFAIGLLFGIVFIGLKIAGDK